MKEQTNNPVPNFFLASAEDFKKIPGSPIAYWVSDYVRKLFSNNQASSPIINPKVGLQSGDNDRFTRYWWEPNINNISFTCSNKSEAIISKKKWFPFNKGGDYRKWYGNLEYIVNWEKDGGEIKTLRPKSVVRNPNYYFKESISCSAITSSIVSYRYYPQGAIFDVNFRSIFNDNKQTFYIILGLLNSFVIRFFSLILSQTMALNVDDLKRMPFINDIKHISTDSIIKLIQLSKAIWDSYEHSWDFQELPLLTGLDLNDDTRGKIKRRFPLHNMLSIGYNQLHEKWNKKVFEMQRHEEENNRILIEAYGLQNELTPGVPLEEITLTCNPHYRYNGNKTDKELETLLLSDTMKEFISYAAGCMFGRYSLDKPGLILANQGETIEEYKKKVPNPTFVPDADNVIPILDEGWFIDDITDRFRSFLRITFGEDQFEENLKFLEQAIGKDIRKYFLKDFFNHHIKMYKKRPIYWMFSSPNGSFNALIYMHRYKPDTVSIVLNNYLREFRSKIAAKKENLEEISSSPSSSQSDKTKALKEIEKLKKVITELEDYERDVLYPLATQQIEIDLDDGVKVNYNKFGKALRKVPGLTGK